MEDPELTDDQRIIIRNTAMAILKNGTSFLEWLMARRKDEAAYSFLFSGKGSNFYNWCLQNPKAAAQFESIKPHVIDNSLSSDIPRQLSLRSPSGSKRETSLSRSPSSSSSSVLSRRRIRRSERSRSIERRQPRHVSSSGRNASPARHRERALRADWVRRRRDERENRRVSPPPSRRGKMYAWSSSSEDESSVIKRRLVQNN